MPITIIAPVDPQTIRCKTYGVHIGYWLFGSDPDDTLCPSCEGKKMADDTFKEMEE